MTKYDSTDLRRAAVTLIGSGHATVAEVAALADTTRQRVQYWVASAGIKPGSRERLLMALWRAHLIEAKNRQK